MEGLEIPCPVPEGSSAGGRGEVVVRLEGMRFESDVTGGMSVRVRPGGLHYSNHGLGDLTPPNSP